MAHRYLIGAALSGEACRISGVDYSEDILASIDCLRALGAEVLIDGDCVTIDPAGFMQAEKPVLECRESGSTLRFFIPLALCMGREVTLRGSRRLMERPLDIYETLCRENGFAFHKTEEAVTLCGKLKSGAYKVRGDISSQFITGLIFALLYLNGNPGGDPGGNPGGDSDNDSDNDSGNDSFIEVLPPFESRSYVDLTLSALQCFGADVTYEGGHRIAIGKSRLHAYSGRIEGDYSNAAFLDAFNHIGSEVRVGNLNPGSRQGDRVYAEYFRRISGGTPTLDISDCPDLGPVLFALAAMKQGAVFTGTDRLKAKESDRGMAMHKELEKLGGGLVFGDNMITVPRQALAYKGEMLSGHNDHRIVMALSLILSRTGGAVGDAQAVRKSYPGFFDEIKRLGAEVEVK